MSRGWAGGSTRRWRRTRAAVMLRDGGRCQLRIPGVCAGVADCVHHTRGRAVTGDDPAYLAAACRQCNLRIGDPTAGASVDPPGRAATQW